MTHKSLPFLLIAMSIAIGSHAQYYNFELSKQAYSPIVKPDLSSDDTSGGILLTFNFPHREKHFMAFGKVQESVFTVGTNGFVLTQIPENGFTFDPFLADLYIKQDTSKVVVAELLIGADSVLEIEWQQMGIIDHPSGDYVNFKMRWFQNSRTIEFHYGPSRITRDSAFQVGQKPIIVMSHLSHDFNTVKEQYFLGGNPDAPKFLKYPEFNYTKGFPSEGTLYSFIDPTASLRERETGQMLLRVYPNPTASKVHISCDESLESYQLMDLSGAVLESGNLSTDAFVIDLSAHHAGVYILYVNTKNQERYRTSITTY